MAGVRGMDRAGQAVVRAAGQQVAFDLGAAGVGHDDHQRRVGAFLERRRIREARIVGAGRVDPTSRSPSSPTMSPTALTTAMAATTTSPSRAVADAETRRWRRGRRRATWRRAAPRPAPTRPVAKRGAAGSCAAASAARPSSGPGRSPPDAARSKIAAAGTIGTGPPRGREAAALFGESLHHAVGGGEPEGRTPRQHDGVDLLDRGQRVEHRGLARRRCPAPDLDRADRALGQHDDGHAGLGAGPVPGLHAGHVGDHVSPPTRRRRRPGHREIVGEALAREVHDQRVDLGGALVHQHVPGARDTRRARASGTSSAIRRESRGGVSASAVPTSTRVGTSRPGRPAVRSRRSSAPTAARRGLVVARGEHLARRLRHGSGTGRRRIRCARQEEAQVRAGA